MNDGTRVGLERSRNRRGAGEGQIPAALLRSSAVVFLVAGSAVGGTARLAIACGGRIDGPTNDASVSEAGVVPCEDAGECNASDSYCRVLTEAGTTSYTCTTFPSSCHTCSCVAPPTQNLVCTCSASGAEITVSCKPF